MTRPVGQIEVWEPGAGSALYTITDFVSVYYREILTSGVGNFTFRVYSHKDFSGTYTYPDIDVGDTAKIWLDWDTVAGDPNFIGLVTKRTGPILTDTGWVREISGLSQGEVLLRRHKSNKFYTGTNASVIVTEWANDLSLGTGDITADTNQPDIEVRTKTYFDLLRHISDYWIDASNKIKKDFWVDLDGDLVWKVRPLRTASVESLGTSDFLVDPQVIRDVEAVKNAITVYGSADKPLPEDKDSWTDSLTNWTASAGSVGLNAVAPKAGTYTIRGYTGAGDFISTFRRDIPHTTIRFVNNLFFWSSPATQCISAKVRLHAPDSSNYFHADLSTTSGFAFNEFSLGQNAEFHAVENPNGVWSKTGSPNWWDIEYVGFHFDYDPNNDKYNHIDGLWFYPDRWTGTASDSGGGSSQALYGIRDHEATDDKLHNDTACTQRAETMLFMQKDLPIQIKIAVKGNDNVLVGDRLSMTIPSEDISAVNYYVFVVENALNLDNWITQATMVNSIETRQTLPSRPLDYIARANRQLREIAMEETGI